MGLRPAHCYRSIQRAYTRRSKYQNKSYVKAIPVNKITKYEMGDMKKAFPLRLDLVSRQDIQIRHNALESARVIINRYILENLGSGYKLLLRLYPHHVLRENKMLTGAGADRMQSGMQRSFGRPVGLAAQVKKGQVVFSAFGEEGSLDALRSALKKSTPRLPGRYSIKIVSS